MDPASTPLGKMLLEEITPVVMVLRTPSVEEACVKNGLSFVEMLTPFFPLRTSSDQPYRLRKFKLRLFYESDIRQPNMEVAKERLKQVITRAGEKDNSELAYSEILPSWFEYLNKELIQTVSFSEHETFDHPVGCLLVVSSKDEQPINKFVDLFNTNKLPALLNDGAMDPKILKHYLLVHDNHGESSEKALKILSEMKSTFGTKDCHLLCINSSQDSETEHQDNPWASYKSDASTVQHLGCRLDVDDISALKDLMHEFSSKHVIPYMEQKVRLLNQQVSATRRGFRNQIKNLWWRKGKDDPNETPSGAMYTFSSIESQIRVLGDHAFMLHDYELALANYRLISTDYKLDKAWKRYAGVQVQLTVTPNIEGTLKLLGVRWKFSGCVVGFYTFESILLVKKLARKKKSKHSPLSNLKFVVVKSVPKLEGLIRAFPEKAYAGHLQRLVLELKNQSDCSIKNLKMKISHPRFLSIGNQEVLDVDFPACLEKRPDSEEGGAHANLKKVSQGVFLFPEDVAIQGDKPLLWPLWLHAAVPGNVPLYVIIYYEMVDTSSVMKYRTLRLHYNLQVLPSLDVSFKISPSPSRLQEFLVRMDVVNKTSSESFQVTQLSSVGNNWGISMLQPVDGIMPSQPLTVGQAFSFFFMLKSHRKAVNAAANVSALSPDLRSDVMLVPESVKEPLFSTSHSPLADFHDCERSQHGIRNQVGILLISLWLHSANNKYYLLHFYRTAKTSPITWTMSGPRTKHHDFSSSFCEISLQMTVHNSSDSVASVIIKTADSAGNSSQSKASGTQGGWQPLATDTKATVSEVGIITRKTESSDPISPVSPFIWSGSSSSKVVLQPRTSAEIPMHICVFYPGTYDLSSYVLNWNLKPVGGNQQEANVDLQRNPDETRKWSGTCKGYPYFLTVLQL
ncbi:Trafficking protein particle complex subunit 8 [Linum perenne]